MRLKKQPDSPLIVRQCHQCGHINESRQEVEECQKCETSFLPLKYMKKIHSKREKGSGLYAKSSEIDEKDLIKGLYVLW